MAAAQTGTGKTAGFVLPMLQQLGASAKAKPGRARALILTPTRELAAQVHQSILTYGKNERLTSAVVFGGVNITPQLRALRRGVDLLVATPGRLLDLYQQNAVRFDDIELLVLDEADRMLDMGFIMDIRKILKFIPQRRQNLMFSATFSREIRQLAGTICRNPIEIDVSLVTRQLRQSHRNCTGSRRIAKPICCVNLRRTLTSRYWFLPAPSIGADKLVNDWARIQSPPLQFTVIKTQAQRTRVLDDFKKGKKQVLVATDIASRGIDIELLPIVVNFDMPEAPGDYIHRIGRTGGRAPAVRLFHSCQRMKRGNYAPLSR